MKNRKSLIAVVILVLLVSAIAIYNMAGTVPTDLVPAWSLVDFAQYRAIDVTDPFVSWAPDSRSLIFSQSTVKTLKKVIFKWNIGDKKLTVVADGASPNFIGENEFLYLRTDPKAIFQRNFLTGKETEMMPEIKQSKFWHEVAGFSYVPDHKSIAVRLTSFTERELAGTLEYDLNGKSMGQYDRLVIPGVIDSSPNADKNKYALVVDNGQSLLSLQVADKGKTQGEELATGLIGAVAWSPDAKTIAYGDAADVMLVNTDTCKRVTVGKFGKDNIAERRNVCRLKWSPDGKYLAVMLYSSADVGDFPLIYILDMSKFSWR